MADPSSTNRRQIFWASFLTLIAAGVGFAVRGGILGSWAADFGFTRFELGTITGGGLVGFGLVILFASLITDYVGYKSLLSLAFVLHVLSALITLSATAVYASAGKDATYWTLYVGMFMFAVANGLCEAVINPLVATLYPKQKTHYLNILHAGWPGGLILGGLLAACFVGEKAFIKELRWEVPMTLFLVPTLWYGIIVLKEKFPMSEARAAGVSYGEMLKTFAAPLLLFLLLLQACVGYVELGTDSWIATITESLLTGQGLILFVYASTIMFILRFFAGPIVERINPLGLLCVSAALGAIGLYLIGISQAAVMIWIAVTIYGVGKTFLWPTMLGVVGERFPRGGAITMGAVGGVGMLSAGLLGGPGIGYVQDYYASSELEAEAPQTFERYKADKESGFPVLSPAVLPSIVGLDGQKVAVLMGSVTQEENTLQVAEPRDLKKAVDQLSQEARADQANPFVQLWNWWQSQGVPNAEVDFPFVTSAVISGGRMALIWTAAVPAAMFVGYLLLVVYFRMQGGYRAIELDAGGGTHPGDHVPSAEEAMDDAAEAPGHQA